MLQEGGSDMTDKLRERWLDILKNLALQAENEHALPVAAILYGLVAAMYTGNECDLAQYQSGFSKELMQEIVRVQTGGTGTV